MKIGIVGSRRRTRHEDYLKLLDGFESLYVQQPIGTHMEIVSGGCPTGADSWAEDIAEEFNIKIVIHTAEWNEHGKGAGIIRNTSIAKDSDILIALPSEDRTGGTEDTIKKFMKFHPTGELILI